MNKILSNISNRLNKSNLLYFGLAFIVPILIMLYVFKKMTIYPFGELSLLHMDLWGQYFPMFLEQHANRLSFDSSLYSWNGALGFNLYAQSAYYTNSLFNYALLLFDKAHLIDALDFLILLKFGLSSLSFSIFLNFKYKKNALINVAFSSAYALCSYTLAFINQTMWFDAVVFFPLILIGLERLVFERKPLMFAFTLALTMILSFYIAFSICIFLVLYFVVLLVEKREKLDAMILKEDVFRFVSFSLLAAGMAAFVLLPVYETIQTTVAASLDVPSDIKLYHAFTAYVASLLPTTKLSVVYGVPNIFSGAFVLLLLPLFIANTGISNVRKITLSTLLGILYFSMNLNILDYVWHGFHLPNQLPGRWTFMVSFLLILTAYEVVINLGGLTRKSVLVSLFNVIFILSLIKVIPEAQRVSDLAVYMTMVGMVAYALVFLALLSDINAKRTKIFMLILTLGMLFDIGIHATTVVPRDSTANSSELFRHADEPMAKIVEAYESGPDDLYRMEIMPIWTNNPGQAYGYKGLSYYASTMPGAAFDFYEALGYRVYAPNVSTSFNPYSPVLNAMLNFKYVIDRRGDLNVIGFKAVDSIDGYGVLENQYYLPFAFMADEALKSVKLDSTSYLKNQEKLLSAAVGEDLALFIPVAKERITLTTQNCEVVADEAWKNQYYLRTDKNAPVELTFTYVAEKDDYVYFEQNFKAGTLTIVANGKEQSGDVLVDVIREAGFIKAGDSMVISVKADKVDVGLWGMQFYTLDQERFESAYEKLKKSPISNIKFETTRVSGTVTAESSGLLYTSIPYDKGWKVKLNGKPVYVSKVADYLIAVDLPAGTHALEFTYHVPGLLWGSVISLLSLFATVLCALKMQGKF